MSSFYDRKESKTVKISSISQTQLISWIGTFLLVTSLPTGLTAADRRFRDNPSSTAFAAPFTLSAPAVPAATVQGVTLEHHLRINRQNGMMIHAHFTVTDRVNIKCALVAYFLDTDKQQVKAAPGSPNRSPSGYAMVVTNFAPGYPTTEYKDLQMFVATSTFHALAKGTHEMKAVLYLMDDQAATLAFGGEYSFTLTL